MKFSKFDKNIYELLYTREALDKKTCPLVLEMLPDLRMFPQMSGKPFLILINQSQLDLFGALRQCP